MLRVVLMLAEKTAHIFPFQNGRVITKALQTGHEDDYFWFVGRADDAIISAGYRIGPFEVESAFKKHPDEKLITLTTMTVHHNSLLQMMKLHFLIVVVGEETDEALL